MELLNTEYVQSNIYQMYMSLQLFKIWKIIIDWEQFGCDATSQQRDKRLCLLIID